MGSVALSSENGSLLALQCANVAGTAQNALAVGMDAAHSCRGHCGKWNCPGVQLGRPYEVTGRLRRFMDGQNQPRYWLAPESPKASSDDSVRLEL